MRLRFLASIAVLALLGACGDGDSPSAPTTTTTTAPAATQADIVVELADGIVETSPTPGFAFRLSFLATLRESAGVGANINFMRLQIQHADGRQETREVGSAVLIQTCGTNRVEANSFFQCRVSWDFNLDNFEGGLFLVVQVTDDRGNVLQAVF